MILTDILLSPLCVLSLYPPYPLVFSCAINMKPKGHRETNKWHMGNSETPDDKKNSCFMSLDSQLIILEVTENFSVIPRSFRDCGSIFSPVFHRTFDRTIVVCPHQPIRKFLRTWSLAPRKSGTFPAGLVLHEHNRKRCIATSSLSILLSHNKVLLDSNHREHRGNNF